MCVRSTASSTIDSSRRKASRGFSEISSRLVRSEMNHVIFRKNRFVPSNRPIRGPFFKAWGTRSQPGGPFRPPSRPVTGPGGSGNELTRTNYNCRTTAGNEPDDSPTFRGTNKRTRGDDELLPHLRASRNLVTDAGPPSGGRSRDRRRNSRASTFADPRDLPASGSSFVFADRAPVSRLRQRYP